MLVKNINTNEVVKLANIKRCGENTVISCEVGGKEKGKKFCEKYAHILSECRNEEGKQYFTLSPDWKPEAQRKANTEAKKEEAAEVKAKAETEIETTKVEDDALELAKLLQRLKGSNVTIDANQVRSIIADELTKLAKVEGAKVAKLAKKAASTTEHHCADFDEICDYVSDGQPVYLYGAAGCGKSHTAEQVANALGLDFYTQSQVLFAHDVKGYGDANGNFQETPFFKAFTKGGLFFIDEMDASAPEALVVLNTAIANRMYDFPVIGNVKAHENFRIIAAGNTALTGADTEYTARAVQDASTINRFAFFEMSYDKAIELPIMAKGDEVLYNFICDLRNAIKETRISLCVSYRQTSTLATDKAVKYGREKALMRNVFGGRENDEIRILFDALADKKNVWAVAMKSLIK